MYITIQLQESKHITQLYSGSNNTPPDKDFVHIMCTKLTIAKKTLISHPTLTSNLKQHLIFKYHLNTIFNISHISCNTYMR